MALSGGSGSNLVIGIRADASALRADMALAEAQVRNLGKELRTAANESLKTGNTTAIRGLAAAFETARTRVAGLRGEIADTAGTGQKFAADMKAGFGQIAALGGGAIGGGAFSAVSSAAAGMTTAIGATTAAVAAASAGLLALAVSGAKAASDIKEGAIRVGVAADAYTKMNFVFSQSGSSAEGFEKAMAIILAASAKAAEAAEKAAADIAAADDKLKQSAKDVTAEVQKTYRDRAEAGRVMQKGLTDSLADIARDEGRALRDLAESRDPSKQLTAEEQIRRQFSERRIDAERAHLEKLAEEKKKAAAEDLELTIKRQREQAAALAAYNKTIEAAAATLQDPFSKITRLTKGDGSARDPVEVFKDIAQAVSLIPDPAARAGKAIELFGRRVGGQLTESLAEGRAGIEKLAKEAEDLGLVFSPEQLKVGKAFSDTLSKLGDVTKATTAKIGLEFSGMFGGVGESWAKSLGEAQAPIIASAKSIADFIKPIFADISLAIGGDTDKINSQFVKVLIPTVKLFGAGLLVIGKIVTDTFELMRQSFTEIAGFINDVFGTKVTAGDIPAFAAAIYLGAKAIGVLTAGFGALTLAASPWLLLLGGIALALGALFLPIDTLKAGLSTIFGPETTESIVSFIEFFRAGATQLYTTFVGTIQGLTDAWTNGLKLLQDTFFAWTDAIGKNFQTWVIDPLVKGIETVIFWMNWLIGLVEKALAAVGLLPGAGSGSTPIGSSTPIGLAGGGRVPGRGIGDTVRAMLTPGEFVQRVAAVRYYGVDFMRRLNALQIPRFEMGGIVDSLRDGLSMPTQRFATGGMVASLGAAGSGSMDRVAVDLTWNGASFAMIAPRQVAEKFGEHARRQQMLSAIKKPSSYR